MYVVLYKLFDLCVNQHPFLLRLGGLTPIWFCFFIFQIEACLCQFLVCLHESILLQKLEEFLPLRLTICGYDLVQEAFIEWVLIRQQIMNIFLWGVELIHLVYEKLHFIYTVYHLLLGALAYFLGISVLLELEVLQHIITKVLHAYQIR